MIRVVLDTNIIISASLSKGSTPDKALSYAIDNTILLISEGSYTELEEKLLNKKFDKYVTIEARKTLDLLRLTRSKTALAVFYTNS